MRETETSIIAEVKRDMKQQKWEEEINAQIASELTVREWCRQNNVNEKTYYYHLRRVREKLCETGKQAVVPVNIPEQSKTGEIHIEKNGLKISLPADICTETLTATVRELC